MMVDATLQMVAHLTKPDADLADMAEHTRKPLKA
ncbi:hypothetical protein ABIB66_008256 [Bradyrhizobium sp. F1.13.3]